MTVEQLALPAKHLRACDISDKSEALCIDQHANAFRASKPPLGINPAKIKELINRVRRTESQLAYRQRNSEYGKEGAKTSDKTPERGETAGGRLLTGQALKDWIRDTGFDGVSTARQRAVQLAKERVRKREE